jgi:hypothetical protein
MIDTRSFRLAGCVIAFVEWTACIASAEVVCVTCASRKQVFPCSIEKSESVEDLPFGHSLLNRACVRLVKATEGLSSCRIAREADCLSAPIRKFSVKEVKRILLDGRSLAADRRTPAPDDEKAVASQDPGMLPSNPISKAWQRFLSMFAGIAPGRR